AAVGGGCGPGSGWVGSPGVRVTRCRNRHSPASTATEAATLNPTTPPVGSRTSGRAAGPTTTAVGAGAGAGGGGGCGGAAGTAGEDGPAGRLLAGASVVAAADGAVLGACGGVPTGAGAGSAAGIGDVAGGGAVVGVGLSGLAGRVGWAAEGRVRIQPGWIRSGSSSRHPSGCGTPR